MRSRVALVPWPSQLRWGHGTFALTASTPIVCDAEVAAQGRQLAEMLASASGFQLVVRQGSSPRSPHIALRHQPTVRDRLGPEGYFLDINPQGVTIRAATSAGVYYGVQSLSQLLPGGDLTVPALSIEDRPRFAWRGAHLDVARHFMPAGFVKKFIDVLAMHKMNRFHWHLTDDQGWRLEIRRHPRLTTVGAWRRSPDPGATNLYGGFYTREEAQEIVAYAAERFVTVVPEIDMPGHSQALVAAYPEMGCTEEKVETRATWGISPYLVNVEPATVSFLQDILSEVMDIFPGPWIHLGGDEAIKTQWKASARVQRRVAELGLKSEEELQGWLLGQMSDFLARRGRRMIGWDEILQGALPQQATVMAWHGYEPALAAVRQGHDVILTPTTYTYFDYCQSTDVLHEPLAPGGYTPLERVYGWEPLPEGLSPQESSHVLGIQGQLWSEFMPDPAAVEYMAFPRLCALAEVAWRPRLRTNFKDFRPILAMHLERLRGRGVHFRPLDPALKDNAGAEAH